MSIIHQPEGLLQLYSSCYLNLTRDAKICKGVKEVEEEEEEEGEEEEVEEEGDEEVEEEEEMGEMENEEEEEEEEGEEEVEEVLEVSFVFCPQTSVSVNTALKENQHRTCFTGRPEQSLLLHPSQYHTSFK